MSQIETTAFDHDYKQALNGTRLHFRVRGANPANPYLLILHGGPGIGAHMYYPWGSSLEHLVNLVYLDQCGGGESSRLHFTNADAPREEEIRDYTFTTLVQDIEAVRDFLKVEKWFVVGHSWGGMLGLEYVAAHPNHILGYIHMDGLLAWPITQEDMLDGAEANLRQQLKSEDTSLKSQAQEQLKKIEEIRRMPPGPQRLLATIRASSNLHIFARPELAQAYDQRVEETMRAYRLRPPEYAPEPLQALALNPVNHLESRDERPLLAKIKVPVLILNGKQDPIITPKVAEMVHRGIPGSEILLIDDCGHFPFSEQPETTTKAVLHFINGQTGEDDGTGSNSDGDAISLVVDSSIHLSRIDLYRTITKETLSLGLKPRLRKVNLGGDPVTHEGWIVSRIRNHRSRRTWREANTKGQVKELCPALGGGDAQVSAARKIERQEESGK